jgi:GNAT superfamily N-acetyltransferase
MSSSVATPYSIEIIDDPGQLRPWTQAQYDAFINTDNVLHEVFFPPAKPPSPAEVEKSADRHRTALAADPKHEYTCFIQILDPPTQEVMGGAQWQFWNFDPRRPAHVKVDWLDDNDSEESKREQTFAQQVMNEFQGRRVQHMACPHALLHICFTVPKYERRGVATALVNWGLERADEQHLRAFTEASPRGSLVYERLGFEVRERVKLRWGEDWAAGKGDILWNFLERPAR